MSDQDHHDQDSEHGHGHDLADRYTQATWDARYAESDRIWSGQPNPTLVERAGDLVPGDALDVGSGEGADAEWLARRGWQVTALDVSPVALERVAQRAFEAGVSGLVTPLHHDLMDGEPVPGDYDLVSAHFMHVPRPMFVDFHRRLGAAVRPGGALLVVGHHPDDVATGARQPHGPDLLFTPEDVVAALDPTQWEVRYADAPTRQMEREDDSVTVRDSVVLAVRGLTRRVTARERSGAGAR